MKRVIRRSVWETNSSTTHQISIMSKATYDEWESGDKYLFNYTWWNPFEKLNEKIQPKNGELYTREQIEAFLRLKGEEFKPDEEDLEGLEGEEREEEIQRQFDQWAVEDKFIKYSNWVEDEYLETDVTNYKTPGGEDIVVCCKYGRDG